MNKIIYLDNAATTKMTGKAKKSLVDFSCVNYFNPSSNTQASMNALNKINESRKKVAKLLGCSEQKIFFTSGATESNNWAILGSAKNKNNLYITSKGEHSSVHKTFEFLQNSGYNVLFIPLQKNGQIDYKILEESLNENTALVSVIFVNNETGAINDIKKISDLIKRKSPKAVFHIDAVQAFCKLNFKAESLGADLLSVSAHKIGGPKGVGALYVKNPQKLGKFLHGGQQEGNMRAGTENVAAIAAFGDCLPEKQEIEKNYKKITNLKKVFLDELNKKICCEENISGGSPYICSLSFKKIKGEVLQRVLEDRGIIIGTGSACLSRAKGNNRVLDEIGIGKEFLDGSIRISFSKINTVKEIKTAAAVISEEVINLQKLNS